MPVRRLLALFLLAVVLLAAIDIIDVHFCKGRLCVAPAGRCHVCD